MLFKLPIIYSFFHLLFGYLSFYIYHFWIFFSIYQLYQYCADVRFYLLSDDVIQYGNSYQHTIRKSVEFILGFSIASITYYMFS